MNIAMVCTICNDTSLDPDLIETTCRHHFHRTCLSAWLDSNETCPICRQTCSKAILTAAVERRASLNPPTEQGPLNASAHPGAIPKGRVNTRSQGRGTTQASSSLPLPTRGNTRRETKTPDSSALAEERINRLISSSMASYRDSMAAVIAEQISAAFRNLNVTQSVRDTRDDPRYGEEGEAAPSVRRTSHASRRDDSFGGGQHGVRASFCWSEIDRPDTISNWRIKFTGSPNDLPLEDFIFRVNCMTTQSSR